MARLAEDLSALTDVRILLIGEAEEGVRRYLDTLRNVTVSEIDPSDIAEGIHEAIGKLYRNY